MSTHIRAAEQEVESRRENRDKIGKKYSDVRNFSFNLSSSPKRNENSHKNDKKQRDKKRIRHLAHGRCSVLAG